MSKISAEEHQLLLKQNPEVALSVQCPCGHITEHPQREGHSFSFKIIPAELVGGTAGNGKLQFKCEGCKLDTSFWATAKPNKN